MVQISTATGFALFFALLFFVSVQVSLELKIFRFQDMLKLAKSKEIQTLQTCQSCPLYHVGKTSYQGCYWQKKKIRSILFL